MHQGIVRFVNERRTGFHSRPGKNHVSEEYDVGLEFPEDPSDGEVARQHLELVEYSKLLVGDDRKFRVEAHSVIDRVLKRLFALGLRFGHRECQVVPVAGYRLAHL